MIAGAIEAYSFPDVGSEKVHIKCCTSGVLFADLGLLNMTDRLDHNNIFHTFLPKIL